MPSDAQTKALVISATNSSWAYFFRSEAAGEITIESLRRARPMTELVQGRPVPVDGLVIGLGPRNLYEIIVRAIEGAIAADAEVGAGRGDQCLGVRQDEPVGNRCGSARQFARQVFALVGVEHRESFQKRD